MTETTPDAPPVDQTGPGPTEPAPVEEEPPAEEEPPGEEQPPVPSDTPCTAAHPSVPGVTCEIEFDNHAAFRLVHTRTTETTTYEWE